MAIVRSNSPPNAYVPRIAAAKDDSVAVPARLQLEQKIVAQVVDTENDRVVLELGSRRYQVPGQSDLRVGETLLLQVQQIEPQLEFKVLSSRLDSRLARALPLLAQPFDWGELIHRLQAQIAEGRLPRTVEGVLNQLAETLLSLAVPPELDESFEQLVARLRQQTTGGESATGSQRNLPAGFSASGHRPRLLVEAELFRTVTALVKNLQHQLSCNQGAATAVTGKELFAEIKGLLDHPAADQNVSPLRELLRPIFTVKGKPAPFSPALLADIQRVLDEVSVQSGGLLSTAVDGKGNGATPPSRPQWQQIPGAVEELLDAIAQRPESKTLPPELRGRLEGLLARLKGLPAGASSLPEMEAALADLNQLVSQPMTTLSGQKLGLLAQLFGLHFETTLLDDKKKNALTNLKSILLELREGGEDVHDPLRRLELFQLCKAKLADSQIQFVPLPFAGLEEGYLLADGGNATAAAEEDHSPTRLSLALRLSALGNVRVDILSEPDGIYLRLAGEDRHKMEYLKSCRKELNEALQALPLKGVSFSADAGLPARHLQERLMPETSQMFDTRI